MNLGNSGRKLQIHLDSIPFQMNSQQFQCLFKDLIYVNLLFQSFGRPVEVQKISDGIGDAAEGFTQQIKIAG